MAGRDGMSFSGFSYQQLKRMWNNATVISPDRNSVMHHAIAEEMKRRKQRDQQDRTAQQAAAAKQAPPDQMKFMGTLKEGPDGVYVVQ